MLLSLHPPSSDPGPHVDPHVLVVLFPSHLPWHGSSRLKLHYSTTKLGVPPEGFEPPTRRVKAVCDPISPWRLMPPLLEPLSDGGVAIALALSCLFELVHAAPPWAVKELNLSPVGTRFTAGRWHRPALCTPPRNAESRQVSRGGFRFVQCYKNLSAARASHWDGLLGVRGTVKLLPEQAGRRQDARIPAEGAMQPHRFRLG